MLQLGKAKTGRKPFTPEQKEAIATLRNFARSANITLDDFARMFGSASWNSFNSSHTGGRKAQAIAENIPKIKRAFLNTLTK